MIEVTIFKNSEVYKGFKFSGHAGFSYEGDDVVCSAVSVLAINCINSIEQFTDDGFVVETDEKAGIIDFKFDDDVSSESNLLMDSLVLGLKAILEDNKQYIKLDFKEV